MAVVIATVAGPAGPIRVGLNEPVRVMALIGSTSRRDQAMEEIKISRLAGVSDGPDVVADLSLRVSDRPLWQRILEVGLPAATLPIYTVRHANARIDRAELLDRAIEQLSGGVGMITIHPTASNAIIDVARADRHVPVDVTWRRDRHSRSARAGVDQQCLPGHTAGSSPGRETTGRHDQHRGDLSISDHPRRR